MVLIDEVILLFTTILIKVKIFNNFIINNKAAQSLEVESLIPLRFGCNKMLFIGDPVQLAATVLSKTALEKGLSQSLFERFRNNYEYTDPCPIRMLNIQYRMHPAICEFPNKHFYKGLLITDE